MFHSVKWRLAYTAELLCPVRRKQSRRAPTSPNQLRHDVPSIVSTCQLLWLIILRAFTVLLSRCFHDPMFLCQSYPSILLAFLNSLMLDLACLDGGPEQTYGGSRKPPPLRFFTGRMRCGDSARFIQQRILPRVQRPPRGASSAREMPAALRPKSPHSRDCRQSP
jgi:hypothetical protein